MPKPVVISLFCALVIAGCSGVHPNKARSASDTTHAADTSAQAAAEQPTVVLSYEERQGSVLFARYCAVCHGVEGKGDGFNAFNLDPPPRDLTDSVAMKALSDDQVLQTITGGGRSVNKSPLMPAYGWTFNTQQLRYLAAYVRTLSRPE